MASSTNVSGARHQMRYQVKDSAAPEVCFASELSGLRCYICDTPKPDYAITRSFSEPICRSCLNFEGPDRVEHLIFQARQFKNRQPSHPTEPSQALIKGGNTDHVYKLQVPLISAAKTLDGGASNRVAEQPSARVFDMISADHKQAGVLMDIAQGFTSTSAEDAARRSMPNDGRNGGAGGGAFKTTEETRKYEISRSRTPSPHLWESRAPQHPHQQQLRPQQQQQLQPQPSGPPQEPQHYMSSQTVNGRTQKTSLDASLMKTTTRVAKQTKDGQTADCCKPATRFAEQSVRSSQEGAKASPRLSSSEQAQAQAIPRLAQHNTNGLVGAQPPRVSAILSPAAKSAAANANYVIQQRAPQYQMSPTGAQASLDHYQMLRTSMGPTCGPVDPFLRIHQQQQYRMEDPASFARELARFQPGVSMLAGDEKVGPHSDLQDANLKAFQLAADSTAPPTMPIYANANGAALACSATSPYYTLQSAQQMSGLNRVPGKQATAQPLPASLYGHYPIAMAPYMNMNGHLLCAPTQYHPYHYHNHHTATYQQQVYNNLLHSPGSLNTSGSVSSQASSTASTAGTQYEKPPAQESGAAILNKSAQGDRHLRRLLTTTDAGNVPSQAATVTKDSMSGSDDQARDDRPEELVGKCELGNQPAGRQGRGTSGQHLSRKSCDENDKLTITIDDNESSFSGDTMVMGEQDCEAQLTASKSHSRLEKQQKTDTSTTSTRTGQRSPPPLLETPSAEASPAKRRAPDEPSSRLPHTKRTAGGQYKPKSLSIADGSSRNSASNVDAPASPCRETLDATESCSRVSNNNKHITQRSQEPTNGVHLKDCSGPAAQAAQDQRLNHASTRSLNSDSDSSPPKSDSTLTSTSTSTSTSATRPTNGSGRARNDQATRSTTHQHEKSSERSHKRSGGASISSTTTHCGSQKVSDTSQQLKQQQQQLVAHHFAPLKCSSCREKLEDRHFVQCPSVMSHKYCFTCSKTAIERQQMENKSLANGFDRVFCPSGSRCFLATEQTPWTFMNSEIETIFRESSRQTSSASEELDSSAERSNSVNSFQLTDKHQQRQNGRHEKESHSRATGRSARNQASSGGTTAAVVQKEYGDGGATEVGSPSASLQTGKVS